MIHLSLVGFHGGKDDQHEFGDDKEPDYRGKAYDPK
jgi:hypothetical protein